MGDVEDTYDQILDSLQWPMVVVTARADDDGERGGCLVGFHTQCSIEPRRHLVMISDANHTAAIVRRASRVAVHFLGVEQTELARAFGELTDDDPGTNKLAGVAVGDDPAAPILEDAAAWFVGSIVERVDVGDHTALLLEPERAERRRPLDAEHQFGFQQAREFHPGHPV